MFSLVNKAYVLPDAVKECCLQRLLNIQQLKAYTSRPFTRTYVRLPLAGVPLVVRFVAWSCTHLLDYIGPKRSEPLTVHRAVAIGLPVDIEL
jgi:hypothetical protein